MNARRTATRWLWALTGVLLLPGTAAIAPAADPPRMVHGSADAFAAPGIALAWAVLRGANEALTQVVIRIDADSRVYTFVAVTGVDPFTQSTQPLLRASRLAGAFDFRSPRSHFADFPRRELRFYRSAAEVDTDAPSLVVYYLGVPDTAPEFADEAKLDAYLADRIARAHKETAGKTQ